MANSGAVPCEVGLPRGVMPSPSSVTLAQQEDIEQTIMRVISFPATNPATGLPLDIRVMDRITVTGDGVVYEVKDVQSDLTINFGIQALVQKVNVKP